MRRKLVFLFTSALVAAAGCARDAGVGDASAALFSVETGSDANSLKAQEVERLAMQIMEHPIYKAAVAQGLADFRASDMATKPEFTRHVASAVDESGTFAAINAAMGGVPEPVFMWIAAAPRTWNGYAFPGGRWFADNVDTYYRSAKVDERSTYEVTIKTGDRLPAQLTFQVYNWLVLENGATPEADVPLSSVEITPDSPRNPDGTITLLVSAEPANGRPNYLQLKPGARQIHVREIQGDWSLPPARLSIRRTGGAPNVAPAMDSLAKEAARYVGSAVFATNNVTKVFGRLTENDLGPVQVRWAEGAGELSQRPYTDSVLTSKEALGFISSGLFNLAEDEALVMTIRGDATSYVGINTYRPYLVSPEHVYGTSGMNSFQTAANPDGTITFVLARKDPGVQNWLDVAGIPYGYIAVRWQTVTRPIAPTRANLITDVRVVKLGQLRQTLPSTMKWVTPEEREQLRQTRARNFLQRCLGTPCEVGGKLDVPY